MIVQNDGPYSFLVSWPLVLASRLSMGQAYRNRPHCFNCGSLFCFLVSIWFQLCPYDRGKRNVGRSNNGKGEWESANGYGEMGKGRKGQGNGVRPVGNARGVRARTFSLLQLLWFIVFVSGTRGIVGGRACSDPVPCGSASLLWQAV